MVSPIVLSMVGLVGRVNGIPRRRRVTLVPRGTVVRRNRKSLIGRVSVFTFRPLPTAFMRTMTRRFSILLRSGPVVGLRSRVVTRITLVAVVRRSRRKRNTLALVVSRVLTRKRGRLDIIGGCRRRLVTRNMLFARLTLK